MNRNKFYWLLRRELWESRSVWMAPAICGAIIVLAALWAAFGTGNITLQGLGPEEYAKVHELTPAKLDAVASYSVGLIAVPFFVMVLFTQFFYALDALYSERRDRSVLFWKSLPISDTETVLSKLVIAGLVMPLAAAAAALATQLILAMIASAKLAGLGLLQGHLWTASLWGGDVAVMVYLLVASALWYLPLLGWCLLVSAWAPRSPVMYATLAPLALGLAEFIAFRSHHVLGAIGSRVGNMELLARSFGGRHQGAGFGVDIDESHLEVPRRLFDAVDPTAVFSTPTLWVGVVLGIGLVTAAVYMRRRAGEVA